jgi:hypothetical protein
LCGIAVCLLSSGRAVGRLCRGMVHCTPKTIPVCRKKCTTARCVSGDLKLLSELAKVI